MNVHKCKLVFFLTRLNADDDEWCLNQQYQFCLNKINSDVFADVFEGSGVMSSELTQEDKDFLSNCAMLCSDGACIMEEQRCDGKRHCVDGTDEHNCQGKPA